MYFPRLPEFLSLSASFFAPLYCRFQPHHNRSTVAHFMEGGGAMGKLGGIFADASRFRRWVAVTTEEAGALRKPGTPVIARVIRCSVA